MYQLDTRPNSLHLYKVCNNKKKTDYGLMVCVVKIDLLLFFFVLFCFGSTSGTIASVGGILWAPRGIIHIVATLPRSLFVSSISKHPKTEISSQCGTMDISTMYIAVCGDIRLWRYGQVAMGEMIRRLSVNAEFSD